MNRYYIIGLLALFLIVYLKVGVPYLSNLAVTNGVVIAYSLFLIFYAVFAYLAGAIVGKGPKALVLFLLVFLIGDLWVLPIMLPMNHPPVGLTPEQSLSSDVFLYQVYSSFGLSYAAIWWLIYLVTPLSLLGLLMLELKSNRLSRYIPHFF